MDDEHFGESYHKWIDAYMYSSMCTGFLMSLVRIREPVFWSTFKNYVMQFCGRLPPDSASRGAEGTMLSFLMSSLNIELVHIILTAVSTRTVGVPKSSDNYKVYQNYDHSNKNRFVIDNIVIPDKKDWDVAEVNAEIEMRKLSVSSRKQSVKAGKTQHLVINEDIQVTEYSPDVFAFLRQKDGYDNSVLRDSLHPEENKR